MKLKSLTQALLMAGLLAPGLGASAAGRADTVAISTPGPISIATGINDRGLVAGWFGTSGTRQAFVYNPTLGALTTLGNGTAAAINASGQITGYGNTAGGSNHAFLYSNGSLSELIGTSTTSSVAYALNDLGQVVGSTGLWGGQHAFKYDQGHWTDLGTMGGTSSVARGINNSGQVVGYQATGANNMAFLYSSVSGSATYLGTLGGNGSWANGISDGGQVVGAARTASGDQHAFLYAASSGMSDLGTLGGTISEANAINATGQVVGYATTANQAARHAALWSGNVIHDLNTLAPSGWTLADATAINRYGQIVGWGNHGSSTQAAFMLTLHPDWQGGDGNWSDSSHWSFGGFGELAGLTPGAPHDVVINPTGSATVYGAANASVSSLRVGGNAGQIVTFNLNGGNTVAPYMSVDANGALAGGGRLQGLVNNQAGGTIKVGSGQEMQVIGAVNNGGKLMVQSSPANAANLAVTERLTNLAGGQIVLQNANVSATGGLSNAGQIHVSYGNTNISGAVSVTSGGKVILSSGSGVTFFDAVDVQSGGMLSVTSGASAAFFGLVRQHAGAVFAGVGFKSYEGGLSIGGSPGLGVDEGSVAFGGANVFFEEIGGARACTLDCASSASLRNSSYDKYVVNGKLSFGGTLKLASWAGYVAQAGDSFDIFDWGSSEGMFTSIDASGLLLARGTRLDTSQLYTSGKLSVAAVPEPQAWALLLAGLGVVGAMGRRRSPHKGPVSLL